MLFDKIALEPDEIILTTVRKHWFVISVEIITIILFGFLPIVFLYLATVATSTLHLELLTITKPAIITFFLAFWLFLSSLAATTAWVHYFLDLWVITDRRVIVIEQVHFFNRKVSNFRLERLQDIKVNITGIIPTLLNYGTLRAQTASAAESNFESSGLPDPRGLQSLIQTAMDERLRTIGNTPVNEN